MICKEKIRKQAVIIFTPPPPSQNYQEIEQHLNESLKQKAGLSVIARISGG